MKQLIPCLKMGRKVAWVLVIPSFLHAAIPVDPDLEGQAVSTKDAKSHAGSGSSGVDISDIILRHQLSSQVDASHQTAVEGRIDKNNQLLELQKEYVQDAERIRQEGRDDAILGGTGGTLKIVGGAADIAVDVYGKQNPKFKKAYENTKYIAESVGEVVRGETPSLWDVLDPKKPDKVSRTQTVDKILEGGLDIYDMSQTYSSLSENTSAITSKAGLEIHQLEMHNQTLENALTHSKPLSSDELDFYGRFVDQNPLEVWQIQEEQAEVVDYYKEVLEEAKKEALERGGELSHDVEMAQLYDQLSEANSQRLADVNQSIENASLDQSTEMTLEAQNALDYHNQILHSSNYSNSYNNDSNLGMSPALTNQQAIQQLRDGLKTIDQTVAKMSPEARREHSTLIHNVRSHYLRMIQRLEAGEDFSSVMKEIDPVELKLTLP